MSALISWINGNWGQPNELKLPLNERGLQLADGLFETVLILDGYPRLLKEHLKRLNNCSIKLGMREPPDQKWLEPLITEAIRRAGLNKGNGALRLNWSRGSSDGRGIDLPHDSQHQFWLTLQQCNPSFASITAIISLHERRNAYSIMSQCKSFAYGQSIQARREAQRNCTDEALLLNTQGELCCGTVSNLFVKRGERFLTPPLSSGCLPGIMRDRALSLGLAQEADLGSSLREDDQVLLINSLSCKSIRKLNGTNLKINNQPEALWHSLIN